jgi:ETFB lysine methyltransferase
MDWTEVIRHYDIVESEIELRTGKKFGLAQIKDINALVDAMGPEDFGPDERLPYWSSLWPVAKSLANYIIENPSVINGPAIELGCGLGLVSLTIASLNIEILATDYEPEAIALTTHNASINGLRVGVRQWDWRETETMSDRFSTIVGADLLYEPRNIEPVASAISSLIKPGGRALIADPNRPHWPQFQEMLVQNGLEVTIIRLQSHVIVDAKSGIDATIRPASGPDLHDG